MYDFNGSVAFFDSGIGGLTVLAECKKRIPGVTFLYFGDNENAPYGNLPSETIRGRVFHVFSLFERLRVRAAVVACNTVTALCVDELRKRYAFPIIGTEPAVLSAAKEGGEIFALTTRATYQSERFRRLCQMAETRYPNARIRLHSCDGLAGAIERRLFDETFDCTPLLPVGTPNSVVLGCTHYVYLKKQISLHYGCTVHDGNQGVANRLVSVLQKNPLQNRDGRPLVTSERERAWERGGGEYEAAYNVEAVRLCVALGEAPIFFLGSHRNVNKYVFEQMFAK